MDSPFVMWIFQMNILNDTEDEKDVDFSVDNVCDDERGLRHISFLVLGL